MAQGFKRRTSLRSVIPAVIFIGGLLLTAGVSLIVSRTVEAEDHQRFLRTAQIRLRTISDQLATYVALLRATAGLFSAWHGDVGVTDFRLYMQRVDPTRHYPGILGIGFVRYLQPGEAGALTERMRREAFPDFAIYPVGPRPPFSAVTLLEPINARNRTAIGFDSFSEAVRREALERARDTGQEAASGRVQLMQEIDPDKQPGFLIYMPVYFGGPLPERVDERRLKLRGYVVCPFRTRDLFGSIFPDGPGGDVGYAVYDGAPAPERLLYRDLPETTAAPRFDQTFPLDIAGRRWSVRFVTRAAFMDASNDWGVWLIGGGGIIATLLVTAASVQQERARRAEAQARRALRQLNITLEQRVMERTQALEEANQRLVRENEERMLVEEQLRQAQKMEAVGRLTGGVAHDFNNLLTVIQVNLDLLRHRLGDTGERVVRLIDGALDGTRRAAALTQRLLAFSRSQPLTPEPIDVNHLVAGMTDLLERTLSDGCGVRTALAVDPWLTRTDRNQLENALLNLAVNARDAMQGGVITIRTANAWLDREGAAAYGVGVAPGAYVLVSVSDTGSGMTPEVISRAFDPFFTTKPPGKGTGLGLSQVYGFARQSGGGARIESRLRHGTTVTICLPRYTGPAPVPEVSGVAAGLQAVASGQTILVVDDEAEVRRFACDTLREFGYRVLGAESGMEALRLLEAHPEVELLLTDVMMPGMSGPGLAEAATRRYRHLRVLFMSGYTERAVPPEAASALSAGRLLNKPFTVEQLASALRAVLLPLGLG